MAGTIDGGIKAAATNMERYGKDYYARIGKEGGKKGHTGGFAANKALARVAGAKGGKRSKRGQRSSLDLEFYAGTIREDIQYDGKSIREVSKMYGVSENKMKRFLAKQGWLPEGYTIVENIEKE